MIDKNISKKIINLINFKNKHILEIGPGKGALTDQILKKNPKTLTLVEKDFELSKYLKKKYHFKKNIKVVNGDILKLNLKKLFKNKLNIIGNLPYNVSSQILIKILKEKLINISLDNLVFMFQKELGEKIIAKFPSKQYGRLSIITNFRLTKIKNFWFHQIVFFQDQKLYLWLYILNIIKILFLKSKIFQI